MAADDDRERNGYGEKPGGYTGVSWYINADNYLIRNCSLLREKEAV
jgi:hypothetical protein